MTPPPPSTAPWQNVPAGDFHRTLLWLRALEVRIGYALTLTLSELDQVMFAEYRSPFKA